MNSINDGIKQIMKQVLNKLIRLLEQGEDKLGRGIFLYMEPTGDLPVTQFAQCESCNLFTGDTCLVLGTQPIAPGDTCGIYVQGANRVELKGKEINVDPEMIEYAEKHRSRCENCRSFDEGTCKLYETLNEALPDIFDLDTKVSSGGCCNAQVNP